MNLFQLVAAAVASFAPNYPRAIKRGLNDKRFNARGHSVRQGKRMAVKAANQSRNRRAHRG